jgi:signal-transduction protein with cAMP-binding, CBS, and nucleotidyltransferase domain
MKRTVSSMMRRDVCVVDMDDTIASVEKRLTDGHLSWAPVLEGRGAIIGVISAADLLRFHAEGRDTEAVRAWQMCTYKPIAVSANAGLGDIAQMMVERSIHHVVVTEGGVVIGVLSSLDFVREFAANDRHDAAEA